MKPSAYSQHYDKLRTWLRARREEKGLSLRAVSALVDRHHSVVGKMEQDRRRIDLIEYVEYCQALGVDPHEGLELVMTSMARSPKHGS